ncbi:MAG: type II secretion system protein [Clostridiaceae bacterium]
MRIKTNRKRAFTLIELIAVMAIIGVLAAALVPKVSKYMTEAKKVKVVAQARTAIAAAEMYNSKNDVPAAGSTLVKEFTSGTTPIVPTGEATEFVKDTSMVQELSLDKCRSIVNDGSNFSISTDAAGKIVITIP